MRQFYLLLAEWYAQRKTEDERVYRLICCWVKDVPAFDAVFPLWADGDRTGEYDDGFEDDPAESFRQVNKALSNYQNPSTYTN